MSSCDMPSWAGLTHGGVLGDGFVVHVGDAVDDKTEGLLDGCDDGCDLVPIQWAPVLAART